MGLTPQTTEKPLQLIEKNGKYYFSDREGELRGPYETWGHANSLLGYYEEITRKG